MKANYIQVSVKEYVYIFSTVHYTGCPKINITLSIANKFVDFNSILANFQICWELYTIIGGRPHGLEIRRKYFLLKTSVET